MNRSRLRLIQGSVLAVGAPLGWLLIRMAAGSSLSAELIGNPGLYLYLLLATAVVFAGFGFVLGKREDELIDLNRKLDEVAVTDALTGLRNARYYHARLDEQQATTERTGRPFAVGVIDLDHFKSVNDRYGHIAGDIVLMQTARAIAANARKGETVARVGGEEFALLLPGSTCQAAKEAAERVRKAIEKLEITIPQEENVTLSVTASAGVASTAELPGLSARELFMAADEALYKAKEEGRNRTCAALGEGESGFSCSNGPSPHLP